MVEKNQVSGRWMNMLKDSILYNYFASVEKIIKKAFTTKKQDRLRIWIYSGSSVLSRKLEAEKTQL
ncbi:MAG: hypothetical protein F6K35_14370 [Okeania sp. SIO2H7]|nr:hypothetical protein [Okeania sp. SIO2H7]